MQLAPGIHRGPYEICTSLSGTSSPESPEGKFLYFTKTTPGFEFSLRRMPVGRGPDSPGELNKLDLVTGKVGSLCTLNKRVDLGLGLSPDGRYLLFAQLVYVGSDWMAVRNFR